MPNTIADNLQRLVTAKTNIANAITEMGGTVNTGDGFEAFPADIATIPSGGGNKNIQLPVPKSILKVPKFGNTWSKKTWSGLTSFFGSSVWTDGTDIYHSYDSSQYVLDKATSTWSQKTWSGLTTDLQGIGVWTDGTDIYYSHSSSRYQYVLDKATSTWSKKTWSGLTSFYGSSVWTDGTDIYCSDSSQYVLSKLSALPTTRCVPGYTG